MWIINEGGKQLLFYGTIDSDRWKDRLRFTRCQSGLDMFLKMWQALVVTELAPEHHSNEKSQRSFTTHRFTDTFFPRSSLSSEINKNACKKKKRPKKTHKSSLCICLWLHISDLFDRSQQASFLHNRQEGQGRFNVQSYSSVKLFLFNFIMSSSSLSGKMMKWQLHPTGQKSVWKRAHKSSCVEVWQISIPATIIIITYILCV